MATPDKSELEELTDEGWKVVVNGTERAVRRMAAEYHKRGTDVRLIGAEVRGNLLILTKDKTA